MMTRSTNSPEAKASFETFTQFGFSLFDSGCDEGLYFGRVESCAEYIKPKENLFDKLYERLKDERQDTNIPRLTPEE